ncbi:MAG: hypothetical protein M0R17_02780 [Candidatus Omnitrophica bacterium]|jgi:hypothetical protein|nr:hypothetical protein [Candidatus Omnitrophota bacterium]
MPKNINCTFAYDGIFCNNKNIKRTFLFGCRICLKSENKECQYCIKYDRPATPTPPPNIQRVTKQKVIDYIKDRIEFYKQQLKYIESTDILSPTSSYDILDELNIMLNKVENNQI